MKENKEETKLQSEQKTAEEILKDFIRKETEYLQSCNPTNELGEITGNDFAAGLVRGMNKVLEEYASQFKSQLPIEQKTMNKQEAIQAMRQGKKVTHRYFDSTEWATITENRIVFEDGVRMRIDDFLSDRQQDAWDTDWSIFQEPLPIEGVEREWISVEERLPEPCDKVTVALSDGCVLVGRLYSNGWSAFFMDGEQSVIERQVTHWQPLPSPPKNG